MSYTDLGPNNIAKKLYRFDRIAEPIPSPDAITADHIEQYRREGYLAVANVFSNEEVTTAKQALAALIGGSAGPDFDGVQFEPGIDVSQMSSSEREPFVRKVWRFVAHEAQLRATAENARLLEICRRLVGDDVRLVQDMALLKPAHHGSEKPWHQDAAYFFYEPVDSVIGTWTALDAATAENGCMHVIPGSHRAGPQAHYHDRDCQLPDETIAVEQDVMTPLPPGATLFFNGLLHHGTPPNHSAARRWALQFHYAALHCRKIDKTRHSELFHDSAGAAGCFAQRRIEDRA